MAWEPFLDLPAIELAMTLCVRRSLSLTIRAISAMICTGRTASRVHSDSDGVKVATLPNHTLAEVSGATMSIRIRPCASPRAGSGLIASELPFK